MDGGGALFGVGEQDVRLLAGPGQEGGGVLLRVVGQGVGRRLGVGGDPGGLFAGGPGDAVGVLLGVGEQDVCLGVGAGGVVLGVGAGLVGGLTGAVLDLLDALLGVEEDLAGGAAGVGEEPLGGQVGTLRDHLGFVGGGGAQLLGFLGPLSGGGQLAAGAGGRELQQGGGGVLGEGQDVGCAVGGIRQDRVRPGALLGDRSVLLGDRRRGGRRALFGGRLTASGAAPSVLLGSGGAHWGALPSRRFVTLGSGLGRRGGLLGRRAAKGPRRVSGGRFGDWEGGVRI